MRDEVKAVSILVLVDVALEPDRSVADVLLKRRVSILVLVDVALEPSSSTPGPTPPTPVSILVLVDVALEPKFVVIVHRKELCFNPCSRGCRS